MYYSMEFCQDDFWDKSHTGFDFDTGDGQSAVRNSKLPAFLKNNASDQFTPLLYYGLDEALESTLPASKGLQPLDPPHMKPSRGVLNYTKNSNPLVIHPKKKTKIKSSEIENTIRKMIYGTEAFSLSEYKSKKDKLSLLEAAEKTHDGNTILEVVLFLRSSLKKSIFQREMRSYPDALNVYLAYLEEDHEVDELANMLLLLNKAEDAAFLKYEAAVNVEDPERKLQRIENCLSTHFQLVPTDSLSRMSIDEHYRILKEQIMFFKHNLAGSVGETEMKHFESLTGRKSVIDSSVICSLIYGCLFHFESTEHSNMLSCPQKMVSSYNLTKKQFKWAALRALSSLQKWSDLDVLFKSKNWLGNFKVRSCIPFSRVLEVLFKAQAPVEILTEYVSFVENEQEKLELAQKYSCHSIAIKVLKNNKDRLGLIKYKAFLDPHSPDLISIIEALNNPSIRWKN